jgi:predicted CoA-binding protein
VGSGQRRIEEGVRVATSADGRAKGAGDAAPQSLVQPTGKSDDELREILAGTHTIAVVGIKDDPAADAYRIPRYLQSQGYHIVPVNPKLKQVLDERAYANLREVDEPVDLVNLFRAHENIPGHVDEILAMTPRPFAVWMQLGIHHGGSAARLRAAGIRVVQDLCIMVEHRQLLGTQTGAPGETNPIQEGARARS